MIQVLDQFLAPCLCSWSTPNPPHWPLRGIDRRGWGAQRLQPAALMVPWERGSLCTLQSLSSPPTLPSDNLLWGPHSQYSSHQTETQSCLINWWLQTYLFLKDWKESPSDDMSFLADAFIQSNWRFVTRKWNNISWSWSWTWFHIYLYIYISIYIYMK